MLGGYLFLTFAKQTKVSYRASNLMEMLGANHDDQFVDKSLRELVLAYMEVVSSLEHEPVISHYRSFYTIFSSLFCCLCPIILLIYYAILPLIRSKEGIAQKSSSVLTSSLKSLQAGEIPFLKLLVLRYLVRLFVSYHIRSHLKIILASLHGEEIKELFSPAESMGRATRLRTTVENLTKFDTILSKSVRLQFALVIVSLLASIRGGVTLFMDLPKIQWNKVSNLPQLLRERPDTLFLLQALGFLVFFFVGWSILSSIVRNRELLIRYNVQNLEQRTFSALKIKCRGEFPLDLLGLIFWLSIVFLPFFLSELSWYWVTGPFVLCAILPVYAFIRRIRLGNSRYDFMVKR